MSERPNDAVLELKDVTKHFRAPGRGRVVHAADEVTFDIRRGQTMALVGESGCGKSTLAKTIVRLYKPTSGQIVLEGQDLGKARGAELRRARRNFSMIFQDPYSSLDGRQTVGQLIREPLDNFGIGTRAERKDIVARIMEACGLSPAFASRHPHQFSGGQRQRIGIARALVIEPTFVVADEPISALDMSMQAQIINLLKDQQQQMGLTYLLVSHDLAVVRNIADRVAVMYLGRIVEIADRTQLYEDPQHPYTSVLLSSVLGLDPVFERSRERIAVRGGIPSPTDIPSGCRFHTRCPIAQEVCSRVEPELRTLQAGQAVACHFPGAEGRRLLDVQPVSGVGGAR